MRRSAFDLVQNRSPAHRRLWRCYRQIAQSGYEGLRIVTGAWAGQRRRICRGPRIVIWWYRQARRYSSTVLYLVSAGPGRPQHLAVEPIAPAPELRRIQFPGLAFYFGISNERRIRRDEGLHRRTWRCCRRVIRQNQEIAFPSYLPKRRTPERSGGVD
jgi:hypothetical protein